MKKQLVIFASGTGSNTINIINYFKNNPDVEVAMVLSNNADAPVLESAKKLGVPSLAFDKEDFKDEKGSVYEALKNTQPNLIILAGFLWKFPEFLIERFPGIIINIHPSLLPKFGGKGMYGSRVHQAVLENNEKKTGITIHWVNEHYDLGKVIFQTSIKVEKEDTVASLQQKIHELEHEKFPVVIEQILNGEIVNG